MSALGVGETGRGAVRAKRSQMGWPSPDGSVVLRHRSWDNRKWFEIWDESTVGTFSNLGFEDDRTGESYFLGKGDGAFLGTISAWAGPEGLSCPRKAYTSGPELASRLPPHATPTPGPSRAQAAPLGGASQGPPQTLPSSHFCLSPPLPSPSPRPPPPHFLLFSLSS